MALREGPCPRFVQLTLLLLALVLVPVSRAASPQDVPLPTLEAPPTLFSTPLGSSQVKLQLSGSWNTDISGSLGYGFDTSGGGLFPAAFPGMTQGFNFQQTPNLDITLFLLDRYFFKTSFVDTTGSVPSTLPLGLNTFVLGYNGKKDEFLQSVRIGNSEVNMGNYGFLSFPAPSPSSIGASAKFKSGNGTYEAMIRYEPASLQRQVFIGHNEITEQRLAPGSYVNGQYFVLPDTNVQNLSVYIEDPNGTLTDGSGRRYRLAGPTDVIVNTTEGIIEFRKPLAGRALVYYTVGGQPVGSAGLGQNFLPAVTTAGTTDLNLASTATLGQFSWTSSNYFVSGSPTFQTTSQVVLSNGQNTLLIYSPGEFSPFQSDNVYSLGNNLPQTNTSVSATLIANGTGGVSNATAGNGAQGAATFLNLPNGTGLLVSLDTTNDVFTVLSDSPNPPQPVDPRSIAVRYPFASLSGIYTNGPGRSAQDTAQQILVRLSTPVTQYQLSTNILAGSLQVSKNGVNETNFTLDYSTGLLTFALPVSDTDVIVATYRTSDSTKPGGDLLFGLGASFDLFPFLKLDVGTGLRWSVFGGSYSTVEGVNTGSALLSAGLSYNEGKTSGLRAKVKVGLSLSSPDTTGFFQLFGMEGAGTSVTMADGNMFPSALPVSGEFSGVPVPSTMPASFSDTNRGELYYNDYHLYTAGGAVLQQMGWPVPSSQQYPYAAGSYTGPYPVYDATYGIVMVMNYQMSTTQNWVGAQVPLSAAPEDLSGAESLTFYVKSAATVGSTNQISAYLQIGSIGENLDGTTTLQTSSSTVVKAFPFDDNGTVLTTTGGGSPKTGGIYASEDTNGNGILDLENSSLVVTADMTQANSITAGSWSQVTIPLTAADRAMLANADAVRIVLVNNTGGTIDSTFEVSSISIAKSPFNVQNFGNASPMTVEEVSDPQPAGQQLEDLFPEVKKTFHPTGQTQKVLEVNWSGATSTSPEWQLTGYPNPVSAGTYKDLVFYLLDPSTTGTSVTVNLTDQNQVGVHAPITLSADNTWHKYSVDLSSGAIARDGQSIGQATVDPGESRYTTVTITSSGATTGTVYLDEIYLAQTNLQLSAGATLDASYSKQGTVAKLFGIPIVSDVSVSEQAAINSPGFASGFESFPSSSAVASSSHFQGRFPFGLLGLDFGVQASDGQTTLSAGHSLTVPLGPVTVGDSYSQTVEGTEMTFNRSNRLSVSLGSPFSFNIQDSAAAIGPSLTQNLQTTASTRPPGPFSLTLNSLFTNQADQYTPPSLDYFRNWTDSYALLGPFDQANAARSGSLQLDAGLQLGSQKAPISARIDLQPSASYQSVLTTGRIQTDLGGITLSFPVFLNTVGGITVVPSYFRTFSASTGPLTNPGFAADFATYGQSVGGANYFFNGIPFEELFSSRILSEFEGSTSGLTAASYQPGVSLALTRTTGSRLLDLFLPARLQMSMSRDLERAADTVTDSLDWQVQYGTDALNLFGSAGAYPIFRFYRTDEFATNVNVSQTSSGLSSVFQNLFTLYFTGNQQIQLDHRLQLSWPIDEPFQVTDNATLSVTYRLKAHPVVPYVPKAMQIGNYLENTESITLVSSPDTLANSWQLNLNHETALVLPNHGQITASAGVGFAENLISAGVRRILFGLQASVGAQLAF